MFRSYFRIGVRFFAPILSWWNTITDWLELAIFGSQIKWLTPRTSGIIEASPLRLQWTPGPTQPSMDESFPKWRGNIYFLVWKFSVSGVEIFRPYCGHFSFSFLPHNRSKKCPHQRRKNKNFHTRDEKISTTETTNFHIKTERLEEKYLL